MLTELKINEALRAIADAFLLELRTRQGPPTHSGWGQYLGSRHSNQIGLYGTCSGIICVSLAYGSSRIPDSVIRYVNWLWSDRLTAGTEGARNFSLTARQAFLTLAVRQANFSGLQLLRQELNTELVSRILSDGLFRSWQIDSVNRDHTGNQVATGLVLLAYALTSGTASLQPDLQRSAQTLQDRATEKRLGNAGVRKLLTTAAALALPPQGIVAGLRRQITDYKISTEIRNQDTLYFWDYTYSGPGGLQDRRDYLHIPSDAIDLLLSTVPDIKQSERHSALLLAEELVDGILASGKYFGGQDIATSKSQAWVALALHRSKRLLQSAVSQSDSLFGRLRSKLGLAGQ